jgi:hypothetical protein
MPDLLRGAVAFAERGVRELSDTAPEPAVGGRATNGKPPGTTLTVAVIAEGALHVAHVGDGSVFLYRDGSARRLAGGEERRIGSRPENYLGSGAEPEAEQAAVPLQPGDRILICTDGLTRYFRGEEGLRDMAGILGRPTADAQAIAGQLTAHSRSDDYDDDTSVVVAEVTDLREVREAPARRPLPEEERRPGSSWPALIVAALAGAALLAAGFLIGRASRAPAAPQPGGTGSPEAASQPPAFATSVASLPRGSVVLLDDVNRRVYLLQVGAPTAPPEKGVSKLMALKVGPSGRLDQLEGRYQLDAGGRRLIAPDGRAYPLARDPDLGVLRILRGGAIAVNQPAGAECWIDDREVGRTPLSSAVAAGTHTVRLSINGTSARATVEVPPDHIFSLSLKPR